MVKYKKVRDNLNNYNAIDKINYSGLIDFPTP
jgi:hypothetical protein